MCARASSRARLSPGMLMVLLLCVCVLAAHFIAEDLLPAGGIPTLDLSAQSGLADSLHEHSEDHFVFPLLTHPPVDLSAFHLGDPDSSAAFGFSISPQLPPPNHQLNNG